MPVCNLTDVQCYYETRGSRGSRGSRGTEAVLMIPGLAATCGDWDPSTHELAEDFTLVQPDNRGIGRSLAKRQPMHLCHYGADLVELLDHLQLDRVHIIGLSLGGIIAQRFAIDHPDRVKRMVLMSCAYQFGPYLREMAALVGTMMMRLPPDGFTRTMELLSSGPMYLDGDPQRLERKIAEARASGVSRQQVARQLRCLAASDPRPEEYRRITAPTLVVAGEYDTLIPPCYGRQIVRLLGDARFMLVRHAGHNLFRECPTRVVAPIRQFLHGEPITVDDDTILEKTFTPMDLSAA